MLELRVTSIVFGRSINCRAVKLQLGEEAW